ncbi:MAG TPA: hypothetical protein VGB03_01600 [Acidimicrobiales bacterium]
MRLARRTLALLLVLAFGACNRGDSPTIEVGDREPAGSSTTSTTDPEEATTSSTSLVPTPLPATGTATPTRGYLAAVRIASHDGFDRVVFEFEDAMPGYRVAMGTRPVTEDGSGKTVEVKGAALLEVRLENSGMARLQGEKVIPVYKGDRRVATEGEVVTEAVDAGDFEGVVTWVVGLKAAPAGVRVTTLSSPYRLVIDVSTKR